MTHVVHVFPALPSGLKDKPRTDKRTDKPLHRCKTLPTKTIAEVRWLYEHGFPPKFLAQIYGLTYEHTIQLGQSTIARKVPPWPPSWINESEWLRLGVPERAFLKKE